MTRLPSLIIRDRMRSCAWLTKWLLTVATWVFVAQVARGACNCSHRLPELRALYDATNGPMWRLPWDMEGGIDLPCTLTGVVCHPERSDVTELQLTSRGLDGTLPPLLGNLTALSILQISDNRRLRGSLPESLANLTKLNVLNASSCSFTGTLSPSFRAWREAYFIDVGKNNISGTLPPAYKDWRDLGVLYAGFNLINGTLPSEYSAWSLLSSFHLQGNRLVGSLPSSYGAGWPKCASFFVYSNNLTGTLPPEYGAWHSMVEFVVKFNQFVGTLPASYGAWGSAFHEFDVSTNRIVGSLPTEYSTWPNITHFRVYSNSISGTLPPEYWAWSMIVEFTVLGNSITGTLPYSYASWSSISQLYIAFNQLRGSIPDAWVQVDRGMMSLTEFYGSQNNLSGTLPYGFFTLPTLSLFSVACNKLSGTLPSRPAPAATTLLFLDVQNNSLLTGTLPSQLSILGGATVCGTGICPQNPFPVQYCVPNCALIPFSLGAEAIVNSFVPYRWTCDAQGSSDAPIHRTTETYSMHEPHGVDAFPTVSEASSISANVVLVGTLVFVGGGGNTVLTIRGAVPNMQRASAVLRLSFRCNHAEDLAGSSPPLFSSGVDNPLALRLPLGEEATASLAYAGGAAVGNGVLVCAFAIAAHLVSVAKRQCRLKPSPPYTTAALAVLHFLPSSLLPGSIAIAFGVLSQPAFAACTALLVSTGRTVPSVICGVVMAGLWLSVWMYCCREILWRARLSDGSFMLCTGAVVMSSGEGSNGATPRSRRVRPPLRMVNRVWLLAHRFMLYALHPVVQWQLLPPSVRLDAAQRRIAAFVAEHLEPVFGAYRHTREWYFVGEWAISGIASGVVLGAAETISAEGDLNSACRAAQWGAWCAIALGLLEIVVCVALQPFRVRFEFGALVSVSVLAILSECLVLADRGETAEGVMTAVSVLEVVAMAALLLFEVMNVVNSRCGASALLDTNVGHVSPRTPVITHQKRTAPTRRNRKGQQHAASTREKHEAVTRPVLIHSDQLRRDEQLKALILLVCRGKRAAGVV